MKIPIKRGGKSQIIEEGVTNGISRCNITDVNPDVVYDQIKKSAPIKITIEFNESDLNGEVINIVTLWKEALISNSGIPLHGQAKIESVRTNEQNRFEFTQMFASALKFIINGKIRGLDGYNNLPVYNNQGQVISYTEEQENQEPTNDYHGN